MKTYKVIGIGLNKTGTKTLAECLKILGYEKQVSCRNDLLARYKSGYVDDVFNVIEQNESFEDWPYPLMYRELFFRFGDRARYILTKRKHGAKWLESLKRHSLLTPPDSHSRLLAFGYNYPHGLEEYHLEFYERHNYEVVKFFEKHNAKHLLLEICWDSGDNWQKLCHFLNEKVPAVPFPHVNKADDNPIRVEVEVENKRRINQQLSLLLKNS
jgi:hypothetical protein